LLQKLTTSLADDYGIIGIEDLHVKGMIRNRALSRAFSDAALGTFLNLLEVKVEQRGGQVVKVGRFFPSTKTCHCCGWVWEDMELSDRAFVCKKTDCAYFKFAQDRDHNAALNILQEALRLIGLGDRRDQVVVGIGLDET
jgi:putative transposase